MSLLSNGISHIITIILSTQHLIFLPISLFSHTHTMRDLITVIFYSQDNNEWHGLKMILLYFGTKDFITSRVTGDSQPITLHGVSSTLTLVYLFICGV